MEQQKTYTPEKINFLLMCCEMNCDGKNDYIGFIYRFYEPSKEIGFNPAALPSTYPTSQGSRLVRFLDHFPPFLKHIEVTGSSKRIEGVYFEIKEFNIDQWEKLQIKESKRVFFYSIVTESGDMEKPRGVHKLREDAAP